MDAHTYLRSVYQDPLEPTHVRMRAAQIAIEYERPRLGVQVHFDGGDLAERLDRAIQRSELARNGNGAKVIEHQPTKVGEGSGLRRI
jgi:hypothetical protein